MYEIYTDGSCLGNPGRGGWAAISKDFKICGAQPNTTNNIMEMTAILRALEQVRQMNEKSVRIFTDSNYTKQRKATQNNVNLERPRRRQRANEAKQHFACRIGIDLNSNHLRYGRFRVTAIQVPQPSRGEGATFKTARAG